MSTSLDAHNEPNGVPCKVENKSTFCSMIESAKARFTGTAIYGKRNAVIRPTWGIGTYGVCVCRPANVDRA